MFDHNIFQDNLVGVDFCEQMVKETNPSVGQRLKRLKRPHAADHGYRTIADIMTALNPFSGEFYRETLHVSRYTREMFCLMEGRHVHPSTSVSGWSWYGAHDSTLY
jgi:hydrogenase large subunit